MTTPPKMMLENPIPRIEQRLYHGRKILVWKGNVKMSSIQGWADNPRIELAKKSLQAVVGHRELSQEEILNLMNNETTFKLKELRDDILKNGLRIPLTLSFNGTLLDGNRRFFAIKSALATMQPSDPNRQDLETVHVFVLHMDATDEDEQNVLVEENFSASLKIEWPDYVKAKRVIDAKEHGLDIRAIADKFNWPMQKVRETIRIQEIIQDFEVYATSPNDPSDEGSSGLGLSNEESQALAAKNYQYFNEAQKSFFDAMNTDIDFKIQFFKWIHEGKFSSFPEVRIAYKAWQNPEAKAAILQSGPVSAKDAKGILDYNERVARSTEGAAARIDTFVRFLKDLTAEEIKAIPELARENLQASLALLIKLSDAASRS
jgi:hypothetical protein